MDFNTALVIIIGIVSVTIICLSALGMYKEYKYDQRAIERVKQAADTVARMKELQKIEQQKKEGRKNES